MMIMVVIIIAIIIIMYLIKFSVYPYNAAMRKHEAQIQFVHIH